MDLKKSKEKWETHYRKGIDCFPEPSEVLNENCCLLPETGSALDLACGLGGNALFLAAHGMETDAWDLSTTAIAKLQSLASEKKLNINAEAKLIDDSTLINAHYDVIVISRFLDRSLCSAIMQTLNPGGLLYYQTFTVEKISNQGSNSLEYLLHPSELLKLFESLRVLFFKDYGKVGNVKAGFRNETQFIGQKSPN